MFSTEYDTISRHLNSRRFFFFDSGQMFYGPTPPTPKFRPMSFAPPTINFLDRHYLSQNFLVLRYPRHSHENLTRENSQIKLKIKLFLPPIHKNKFFEFH